MPGPLAALARMMARGPVTLALVLDHISLALRLGLIEMRLARGRGVGAHHKSEGEKGEGEQRSQHGFFLERQWPNVRQKMNAVIPALRMEMTIRALAASMRRP